MDTAIPDKFNDIRPLNDSEVKDAIELLVSNADFEREMGRALCRERGCPHL